VEKSGFEALSKPQKMVATMDDEDRLSTLETKKENIDISTIAPQFRKGSILIDELFKLCP